MGQQTAAPIEAMENDDGLGWVRENAHGDIIVELFAGYESECRNRLKERYNATIVDESRGDRGGNMYAAVEFKN